MNKFDIVVLVSAKTEWRAVRALYPDAGLQSTPFGECFAYPIHVREDVLDVCFAYGGWGKISAAASAQYAIDTWSPDLLVNMGTCGGFEGLIQRDTIILVNRTQVYDIIEQMGDQSAAIKAYTTELDYSWLKKPFPYPVKTGLLISGDRDLVPEQVEDLHRDFGAVAGDWESASIAYVAAHNGLRCLILRMVTDLVGSKGGEVYDGKLHLFHERAHDAMGVLVASLPEWLQCAGY